MREGMGDGKREKPFRPSGISLQLPEDVSLQVPEDVSLLLPCTLQGEREGGRKEYREGEMKALEGREEKRVGVSENIGERAHAHASTSNSEGERKNESAEGREKEKETEIVRGKN